MESYLLTSYLKKKKVLTYYWLYWVPVAVCGLSLGAVNGGSSSSTLIAVVPLVAEHSL